MNSGGHALKPFPRDDALFAALRLVRSDSTALRVCVCACFLSSLRGGAGSSSRLHTCALRPAAVVYGYGTPEQDG